MTNDLVKRLRLPPFGTETSERNLMLAAADHIDALSAALTKSRAETAAAYEQIANEVCRWSIAASEEIRALAKPDQTAALDQMIADAEARGMHRAAQEADRIENSHLAANIRALVTPDQTAARDRMIADAEARVVKKIAAMVRTWRNTTPMTGEECANAILAAIAKGGDA